MIFRVLFRTSSLSELVGAEWSIESQQIGKDAGEKLLSDKRRTDVNAPFFRRRNVPEDEPVVSLCNDRPPPGHAGARRVNAGVESSAVSKSVASDYLGLNSDLEQRAREQHARQELPPSMLEEQRQQQKHEPGEGELSQFQFFAEPGHDLAGAEEDLNDPRVILQQSDMTVQDFIDEALRATKGEQEARERGGSEVFFGRSTTHCEFL